MTGGNNVNHDFYRSVKLQINPKHVDKIRAFHRGLDFTFYPPVVDGENLFKIPGYNTDKIDWCDVTITAKDINPQVLHERNERDIDEELAMIDSKWRILKDHLRHTDNKELIHEYYARENLTRHDVILDHPYLDGQNDYLRSKARDVHEEIIPMESVKLMEQYWERRMSFFKRTKLKEYKPATELFTGRRMAVVQMGIVGS